VDKCAQIITEQSRRLGQWMDWKSSYYTYSDQNIEYIWYFLKKCHSKGWLEKRKKVLRWCDRCGTSLSQHEMSDSYQEIVHKAVTVRFELKNSGEKILAWTTTPWTLPANKALAVHPAGRFKNLIGQTYIGPYGNEGRIVGWSEVSEDEGTGIVHIAPACGEEDFVLAQKAGLEIGETPESYDNKKVIDYLEANDYLEKIEDYRHRYPVCWRCKSELVFRLESEWFIKTQEIRPRLKREADKINWEPKGIKARMQDWLDNMADWNISRKRYWGLPLPFYLCACGHLNVIASKKELKEKAVKPELVDQLPELHRPWIDEIKIYCEHCQKETERIPEVGDCWLDAGIVPYSTLKYLENKPYWKRWFPADFISEMREQIRLWFYSMLFMSVVLEDRAPYKNVLAYEKVRDEKGNPMHKSAGNTIWFDEAVETMGADVMRWAYLRQNPKYNLSFGYNLAKECRKILDTYYNSYLFYKNFLSKTRSEKNILDQWILVRLNQTIKTGSKNIENYRTDKALELIEKFIDDLSNWYIRRSRKEINPEVLREVLTKLSRLLAPIAPFISEEVYLGLGGKKSVHLSDWPQPQEFSEDLILAMAKVREISTQALAQRKHQVRQPLAKLEIPDHKLSSDLILFIKEEVNVKEVLIGDAIRLDNELTPELIQEGGDRDLIRKIQVARKNVGLSPKDYIAFYYSGRVSDLVKKEARIKEHKPGDFRIEKI